MITQADRLWWIALAIGIAAAGCNISNEEMIEAAADGQTGKFLKALRDDGDPNFRSGSSSHEGETALSAAARGGHRSTVEALLRRGIKPAEQPEALVAAGAFGDVSILHLILDHGADPNAAVGPRTDGGEQRTPLGQAARHKHSKAVRALLANKAQANAHNSVALREAIRGGDEKVIRLLLQNGASATAPSPSGATPLHLAAELQIGRASCRERV
jgi:ankyrin repeat protein